MVSTRAPSGCGSATAEPLGGPARGVANGLSTPEIAADLFLSGHTVRDYIKSVFEKVGVGSRGELIAKLFAEHYADTLHERMVHVEV